MFKVVFLLLLLNQGTHCYTSRSPPVFISQQSNVYIFNQQNLTLSCSIDTPSPTVNYTWFRGIQKLPGSMVNESGSLVIPNITEGEYASREGVDYYCIASDNISFNVAVRSRTITVYYAYFDGFERMAESNESTMEVSIPVAVNSDVALECDVLDAKPRPKIKWYDDQGEIQEVILDNSVRFLDDGRYLYLRRLQPSHLDRQYYCSVTNANLIQEISAATRYVLTDNLTQGVLMDYKQIGNWTAFIGNSSFEFAYVGGVFGSNNVNRTSNRLFVNGSELVTLGNVGKITLLSSPGIIQLRAIVRYDSVSVMRNGSVTVHQIPRIINTIQDVREHLVGEGNLTFTCQCEGSPLPNITFYHNGAIISPGSGMSNILTIPSPQVPHSGIYQCIVSNEFGDDQIAWFLEIRQPILPKVIPLNLTELGALEDQDVGVLIVESINSTTSFFVDVEAYPCPSVVWRFNGITLGPSNISFTYNNPCIEASERSFIWTFAFNVVLTSTTSGQYMANFTNINGTTSLPRIYITIPSPGPASIVSLNLSEACLIEGSNVSLRCLTNGFPRPNIEFRLNNLVIIPGVDPFENFMEEYFDQLMITDVTVRAEGRYSCSVAHVQQPMVDSEEFKFCTVPHITGIISTSNPCIGERLFLECIFTAIPVNVVWKRGVDVLNTTDDRYRIVTTPDNSSGLEVFAATSDFNGIYECIISNDAGSDNRSFYIELKSCVNNQDVSLSLSDGAKIGISIGVLAPVCLSIITIIIIALVRRHKSRATAEYYEILSTVDNATFGEEDWNILVYECSSLSFRWDVISEYLGLQLLLIDSIRKSYHNDSSDCWNDALWKWISLQYDTRKFGEPSWRTLLKAVAEVDELSFKQLADKHRLEGQIISGEIELEHQASHTQDPWYKARLLDSEYYKILSTVDNIPFDNEEYWNILVYECRSFSSSWKVISAYLGLPFSMIKGIQNSYHKDNSGCWNDALWKWTSKQYNTRKFGEPSWRTLLTAVAKIDKLSLQRLANKHRLEGQIVSGEIELEHQASHTQDPWYKARLLDSDYYEILSTVDDTTFDVSDLKEVVLECTSVYFEWEQISALLGLPYSIIMIIQMDHVNDMQGCWFNALMRWLRGDYNTKKFGMPSWRTLLSAVAEVNQMEFKKLANKHKAVTVQA